MSEKESRDLILRYFHEFVNKHDSSVLRELCSPQILDHNLYAELPSAPEYAPSDSKGGQCSHRIGINLDGWYEEHLLTLYFYSFCSRP
jgi:hypothetical protein